MIKATVSEKFRVETKNLLTELADCFAQCDISIYGYIPSKVRELADALEALRVQNNTELCVCCGFEWHRDHGPECMSCECRRLRSCLNNVKQAISTSEKT